MRRRLLKPILIAFTAAFLSFSTTAVADESKDQVLSEECPAAQTHNSQIIALPGSSANSKLFQILAVTRLVDGNLRLRVDDINGNQPIATRIEKWGYSPRAVQNIYTELVPGHYQATLIRTDTGEILACSDIVVAQMSEKNDADFNEPGVWKVRKSWTPDMEDLFSVFVAKLFHVRPGSKKGWRPLHQATRDPFRNILYGSLGLNEDSGESKVSVSLAPDCADSPYFVRAYFAWKMGLPLMFNECRRGNALTGPRCMRTSSNLTKALRDFENPVSRFNAFVRQYIGWRVHAGNPLTLPDDKSGDFYSIELNVFNVRPGTVFVDGGGHIIMVSQFEPQQDSSMGVLYGVDAHPDKTVTHKRFGKGTFVFNGNYRTDGFKAFRPVLQKEESLEFVSNEDLDDQSGYLTYSMQQSEFEASNDFYDHVTRLLNPRVVDPQEVLKAKVDLFHETILERIEAVQTGVDYMHSAGWKKMSMPKGASIFQTTGLWETYSTPARDLRCFLALDDVMDFPHQVVRNLPSYSVDEDVDEKQLLKTLIDLRDQALEQRTFEYMRSDATTWTLTLKDVVDRQKQLEMAYNPNDCPETRWAAPNGSDEQSTCYKKAPANQRRQMRIARAWFSARRRPDQR